jgi:hypothetical protein
LARETEVLGENLPQCYFIHNKPHMLCSDANLGRRGGLITIAELVQRRTTDWTIGVRFLAGANLSLLHAIRTSPPSLLSTE